MVNTFPRYLNSRNSDFMFECFSQKPNIILFLKDDFRHRIIRGLYLGREFYQNYPL